jgi:hypothetical protein
MKTVQATTDKLAIGFSLACVLHCLLLPSLLVLLPILTALHLDSEAFHFWLVFAVIPTSLYAITMGCKQHKRYRLFALCGMGLVMLLAALLLEEVLIGVGEQLLTIIGSCFIVTGHWLNFRLCRLYDHQDCDCSEHGQEEVKTTPSGRHKL